MGLGVRLPVHYVTVFWIVLCSLDHTPNFCRNLVIFRSRNMCLKESHPVFYGDSVYKLRRVKDTLNFISSGSKVRRRQYDPLIIERTICLLLGPCTDLS